jgi:DNA invertase Pin-like site-specific DNA recombinase
MVYGYVRTATNNAEAAIAQQLKIQSAHGDLQLGSPLFIIEDVCSGMSKPESRPGWSELLKTVQWQDVVIVASVDRISRDADDLVAAICDLHDRGVEIHIADPDY